MPDKKKFDIDDYDNLMEGVRQKHRRPLGMIQRLREVAQRRRLPRIK